jgi:hypothetical protein
VELGSDASGLHLNRKPLFAAASIMRSNVSDEVDMGYWKDVAKNWEGAGDVMFGGATEVSSRRLVQTTHWRSRSSN